jgi:hypothetical protein
MCDIGEELNFDLIEIVYEWANGVVSVLEFVCRFPSRYFFDQLATRGSEF